MSSNSEIQEASLPRPKEILQDAAASQPDAAASAQVSPTETDMGEAELRDDAFRLPTKEVLFETCHLSEESLSSCGLSWGELQEIAEDHLGRVTNLTHTANYIAERLRALEAVHSVKVRVKDPAHLIHKIVRKRLQDPQREITRENYTAEITDLIGIRALHLFKVEWLAVHRFVRANWEFVERATANIRKGDPEAVIDLFRDEDCAIREHPAGYRSVHYLLQSRPARETVVAELQVRTIFEEGWSEIDHRVRYAYATDDGALSQLLEVFNRLAGSADEMGSFVRFLHDELVARDERAAEAKYAYEITVSELRQQIDKLQIDAKVKEQLEQRIQELEQRSRAAQSASGSYVAQVLSGVNIKSNYFAPGAIGINDWSYITPRNRYLDLLSTPAGTSYITPQSAHSGSNVNRTCKHCGTPMPYSYTTVGGSDCCSLCRLTHRDSVSK